MATDGFSLSSLPPQSQKWRREVEDRLIATERNITDVGFTLSNNSKSINATLEKLTEVVSQLRDQQAVLRSAVQRLRETNLFHPTPYPGVTSGTGWVAANNSVARPSWAFGAVIQSANFTVSSSSLNGFINIEAYANNSPITSANPNSNFMFASGELDNTTGHSTLFGMYPSFIFLTGQDELNYRVHKGYSDATSGTVNFRMDMVIQWIGVDIGDNN